MALFKRPDHTYTFPARPTWQSIKRLSFIPIYIGALLFSFQVLQYTGFVRLEPTAEGLMNWDSGWYQEIKDNGYEYAEDRQSSSGFYPLFPLLWKLAHTGPRGISLINFALVLAALGLMAYTFRMEKPEILLFLSFPSMLFIYVPYSESLYFFCCTLFAVGILKQWRWLACAGILLASMTRPTALFFIPAFICMEFLSVPIGKIPWGRVLRNIALYSFFALLGVFLVLCIQYAETGVWNAYFKAHKHWQHHLKIPGLPFVTWDNHRLIWLDGLALLTGTLSGILLLRHVVLWIRKVTAENSAHRKIYLFSLAYLALVMLSLLLYNHKGENGQTSLFALNRYIFVSPFPLILVHYAMRHIKITAWQFTGLIAITYASWLLLGSYVHTQTLLFYGFITLYPLGIYLFTFYHTYFKSLWVAFFCLHLFLQHWLLQFFLQGFWVG